MKKKESSDEEEANEKIRHTLRHIGSWRTKEDSLKKVCLLPAKESSKHLHQPQSEHQFFLASSLISTAHSAHFSG